MSSLAWASVLTPESAGLPALAWLGAFMQPSGRNVGGQRECDRRFANRSLKAQRRQIRQRRMEPLWSPAVATGGNPSQIGSPRNPQTYAKTVAGGCDLLPESFHGKEGVSGSSPEEGSAKPRKSPLFRTARVARAPVCGGYGAGYGAFRFKRPLTTPRIRTRSRRLDEAAFERHAD